MLVASSAAAAATRKRDGEGECRFWRTSFIGGDAGERGVAAACAEVPVESDSRYPVAYGIELDAGSALGVHFHHANQFQVFVAGDGRIGRHAIDGVTVHYTSKYSAYGPICPGRHGLHFVTLRDAWDPGARMLPAHADELRLARVARREAVAESLAVAGPATLQRLRQPHCATLFAATADALGAWAWQAPPEAAFSIDAAPAGGGQFLLVLAGGLRLPGEAELPPLSSVFISADERGCTLAAGAAGVQLLVLRFPHRPADAAVRPSDRR